MPIRKQSGWPRPKPLFYAGVASLLAWAIIVFGASYALSADTSNGKAFLFYYTKVYTLPYEDSAVRTSHLRKVNVAVNGSMTFREDATNSWSIGGAYGDCEDFALTKLVRLNSQGVPLKSMRIARGRAWGRNHMVLLVRGNGTEYVLDNLASDLYVNDGRFKPISRH